MEVLSSPGFAHTVQSAECDDGMPPESTIALISQMPFFILLVKICANSKCSSRTLHHAHNR